MDDSMTAVPAQAWMNDPGNAESVLVALDSATVLCERTDTDEIAIHTILSGDDQATASAYLTVANAARVAAQLLRIAGDA